MTTTPFDATDSTAVATSATAGGAAATVETDVTGDVTSVGISTPGSGYSVGDTVTFEEDGGAGVFTARVASIS